MIKFLAYLLCYLIYPIAYLFPRSKDIYAFGCFHGIFADNPKYLFFHINEHLKSKKAVWLSPDKKTVQHVRQLGFNAYYIGSIKGIWYAMRAKYWFINCYTSDILFCLAGGATVVNLWHGVPMKCIEFGITKGELTKRYVDHDFWEVFYHPASFRRPDIFASTTPFFDDVFSKSFRISKDKCIHVCCARNSLLMRPLDEVEAYIQKYEPQEIHDLVCKLKTYKTVFVYMPTWRDSQAEIFANGFDLEKFNTTLKKINAIALMKPHVNTKIKSSTDYSNLLFLDNTIDMYSILPFTDVLISDYSGTIYDYLLMDKGIILFHYDYDEYVKEREFIFPIEENITGKRVFYFEELIKAVENNDYYVNPEERQRILDKFWGNTIFYNPCEQIVSQLHLDQ